MTQTGSTDSQSSFAASTRARGLYCRITGHYTGTEAAHICPVHEERWFTANKMSRWNTNRSLNGNHLLNDSSNAVLLRSDLRTAFDDRKFVHFPKSDKSWVVHLLEFTNDLGKLYHNVKLHPITSCSLEFLYARFAWGIFPFLATFLSGPSIKRLVVMVSGEEGITKYITKNFTKPAESMEKAAAHRSRRTAAY